MQRKYYETIITLLGCIFWATWRDIKRYLEVTFSGPNCRTSLTHSGAPNCAVRSQNGSEAIKQWNSFSNNYTCKWEKSKTLTRCHNFNMEDDRITFAALRSISARTPEQAILISRWNNFKRIRITSTSKTLRIGPYDPLMLLLAVIGRPFFFPSRKMLPC